MFVISPLIRLVGKIATLCLYLVTLLSIFGGKVNPTVMTIPALLTLAMPYLVILTAIVALVWIIGRRIIIGALGLVIIFLCWSSIRPACPVSFPSSPAPEAKTFSILSFNSLHLKDIKERETSGNRAAEFLIKSGADIICLQELINWNDSREIPDATGAWRDSLFAAYPYRAGSVRSDLKILSKFPVRLMETCDPGTGPYRKRFQHFRVTIDGERLDILNMHLTSYDLTDKERKLLTDIHGPESAKESVREFKSSIFSKLKSSFRLRAMNVDSIIEYTKTIKTPLIVCGDFNDVPSSWAYRKMVDAGFNDAYVETSFGPTFTFNQHLFLFHIDQIFYRGDLKPLKVKRLRLNTSDHYPIEAEFEFLPKKK